MPRSDGTNGAYETHGTHETSIANPISLATRSAFGVWRLAFGVRRSVLVLVLEK